MAEMTNWISALVLVKAEMQRANIRSLSYYIEQSKGQNGKTV